MKPINLKCQECAVDHPGRFYSGDRPECWKLRKCSRLRYHYRNLEKSRLSQRERHRYVKYRGTKCALCASSEALQCHHIIPQLKGGADDSENVVTLCAACHRLIEAYRKMERSILSEIAR